MRTVGHHGAVVDHQFGTTDVCMVLPKAAINPRSFDKFGAPDAPVGIRQAA